MEKTIAKNRLPINVFTIIMISIMGMMSAATGSIADKVAVDLAIPAESMGLTTTFYAIGMLIGSVAGGVLAEKYGKRIILFIGCAIMAAGMFLQVGFGSTVIIYMLGSFFGGFGFTPCEANGNALLGDNNPGKESMVINICQMFYAAFAIVAPIGAVAVVSAGYSWKVVYLAIAIAYVVIGVIILCQKEIDVYKYIETEKDTMKITESFKSKAFVLLCLMMLFGTCAESVAVIYGKIHLMDYGIAETQAAIGVSLYQAGLTLGRFICIFLSGKEAKGIKTLSILVPIGIALVIFAPSASLKIAGMALFGLGIGPVWPLLFVLALKVYPTHTSIAGSALDMFMCLGYIIWPTVIGVLMSNATTTLTICFATATIVFILSLLFKEQRADV